MRSLLVPSPSTIPSPRQRSGRKRTKLRTLIFLILLSLYTGFPASAIERPEQVIDTQVGVFTELGAKVNLSRRFTDSSGVTKSLAEFALPGKPIVIAPVYYRCPRLCGLLLDGVYNLINELPLKLGADFSVLLVGFNPNEGPLDAKKIADKFNPRLTPAKTPFSDAVHYLTSSDPSEIAGVMNDIGFKYLADGEDFAHSAAIMVLTPGGEISQYFTGIVFSPWDVKLSLVEASQGKIGNAVDHLLLYCFRFDPLQGRYTWAVVGLLRVGGALTLAGLALVYLFFVVYGKKGRAKGAA